MTRSVYEVTFYFGVEFDGQKNYKTTIVIPAYMCKPAILMGIAFSHRALFVTCDDKYGCRQFNPWYKGVRPEWIDASCISVPMI